MPCKSPKEKKGVPDLPSDSAELEIRQRGEERGGAKVVSNRERRRVGKASAINHECVSRRRYTVYSILLGLNTGGAITPTKPPRPPLPRTLGENAASARARIFVRPVDLPRAWEPGAILMRLLKQYILFPFICLLGSGPGHELESRFLRIQRGRTRNVFSSPGRLEVVKLPRRESRRAF